MNIQPLGSPFTQKLDDRTVPAADSAAGTTAANPSRMQTDPAVKTAAPTREEVDSAVKKLNESLPGSSQTLQFSVDHDSKEIVVKLIDQNTQEVVRQIPSAEALRIAKSIDKMQGLLIHQKA
ncbi:flagellar protein FlaG [Massilia putida]|uniref:flagellar protein FlaG n=1 Tax=Massilia putida TaxID=1141883 RepID=UPI000950DC18|nr:flagellar protein FlaG [Massilia putida]